MNESIKSSLLDLTCVEALLLRKFLHEVNLELTYLQFASCDETLGKIAWIMDVTSLGDKILPNR